MDIQRLAIDQFREKSFLNSLTYEDLFKLIKFHDDIDVCKIVRGQLYYKISKDFLEDYIFEDIFDASKQDSYEIFQFFKQLMSTPIDFSHVLKKSILFDSSSQKVNKSWDLIDVDLLSFIDLAEIICVCQIGEVREKCWLEYSERVQELIRRKEIEDENLLEASLLKLCSECSDHLISAEAWRLLKQVGFSDETCYNLVVESDSPEIAEYAWKYLLNGKLDDEQLIEIIRKTCSKPIALQALDIFRKRKI